MKKIVLKIMYNQSSFLVFSIAFATIALTQDQAISQVKFSSGGSLEFAQSPPQGTGTPNETSQAGSRNPCPGISKKLTLLIGGQESYTTEASPTFWFYVPYEQNLIESVMLSVRSEREAAIDLPITLRKSPGFSSFTLPQHIKLNQSQSYDVVLIVRTSCDESSPATEDSTIIQVRYRKLESSLSQQFEQIKTPKQRVQFLVKHGFWIDAFALSAQNFRRQDWEQLLRKTNLETSVDLTIQP